MRVYAFLGKGVFRVCAWEEGKKAHGKECKNFIEKNSRQLS